MYRWSRDPQPCRNDGYGKRIGVLGREVSLELIRFYEDRARGGCGLIFTEFTRMDETSGACNPNQLCIATRKHIRSTERVHCHGARIFVQLYHGGRESLSVLNDGKQPMAPSAILNSAWRS